MSATQPLPLNVLSTQSKITNALLEGRPVRTGDLMELGDEEIQEAAHSAFSLALRQVSEVINRGATPEEVASLTQDTAETLMRLPPKINQEIADTVDTLPPKAAAGFVNKLKAKGVCPI